MTKKPKTYGRNPARRWMTKQALLGRKWWNLRIVKRRGKVWWFTADYECNLVCTRYGKYTLRRLPGNYRLG